MDSLVGFIAAITLGLISLLLLIGIPIQVISYYGERESCATWSEATGRETKFVHLVEVGVPFTWDCFTPDENGRWIPKDRVRDID